MKILVVDDDEISRRLIARGLQRAGYETLEADSADAALALLRKPESIALVITDVMMSETDGLDLIAQLRTTPGLAQLPVLICSSLGKSEIVARAAELNVAGYLLKPIQIAKLRGKVRQVMEAASRPLADIRTSLNRLETDMDGYLEMLGILDAKRSSGLAEIKERASPFVGGHLSAWVAALGGAAANLGAERLAGALQKLVTASEQGYLKSGESLVLELEREVLILRNEVQSLQKPQPQSETTATASTAESTEVGEANAETTTPVITPESTEAAGVKPEQGE